MPTSIPDLPLELLYLIAKHLGIQALLAFSRTCHILHHLLTPQLNIHLATRAPSIVCLYLRRRPHPSLLQRALSFCPPGFFIHDLGLLTDLITWGFTDTVRLLLQHRVVDPNSYRKGEWEKQSEPTPLLAAVYSENMEVIGLLLDAGASVALGCPQPVEVARRLQRGTGKGEIVRLLEKFGRQKSSKAEGNLK